MIHIMPTNIRRLRLYNTLLATQHNPYMCAVALCVLVRLEMTRLWECSGHLLHRDRDSRRLPSPRIFARVKVRSWIRSLVGRNPRRRRLVPALSPFGILQASSLMERLDRHLPMQSIGKMPVVNVVM